MKCNCGNETRGKSKHCSPACKQRAYRNRTVTDSPIGVTVTGSNCVTVADHAQGVAMATDPDVQQVWDRHEAQRRPTTYPHQSRLTNLALPGDDDYDGVCHKNEQGAWTC